MHELENARKQASSKFRKAYKALMDLAGKVDDVRTQLIAALVALVKGYPDLSISTRDARLTFYQDMKMSTYDGKGQTYINVHSGQAVKCSNKNAGLPKDSSAIYVQEQLAKIDRACEQLKRLDTVLAQCNSTELIEQWTGKILKLANSICSEVVEQEAKKATQAAQKPVAA